MGWELVDEFVDEGISGAKGTRPALDVLMATAREQRLNAIVVTKLDRFGRSSRHLENALGDLDDWGVRFVSLGESFDSSTAAGRLMRTMLGGFAQFERDRIRDRMMDGQRQVAIAGYWPGGPPPYGFRVEAVDGTKHKRLAIDEDEATVVRLAVEMLINGATTSDVANLLNAEGARPRRAKRWTHAGVRRMLQEIPLSGTWLYGRPRTPGRHQSKINPITLDIPSLITPARERRLRTALSKTAAPHVHDQFYVFPKGTVKGRCGSNYFGTYWRVRGYRQYQCAGTLYEAENRCECRRLDANQLEDAVWAEVTTLLSDPDRLLAMAKDYLGLRREQVAVESGQLSRVASKIARLERTLTETVVDYARAGLPADAVTEATKALQAELAALRSRHAQLAAWQAENLAESDRMRRLWELGDLATRRLATMSPIERRKVVALLDLSVTILGWNTCPSCNGRGKVKGGRGGSRCERCVGLRQIARVRIEGHVYDLLVSELGDAPNTGSANVCEVRDVVPKLCRCC
jgi:DNA invertase Pin-like site-specific DNA recombinase